MSQLRLARSGTPDTGRAPSSRIHTWTRPCPQISQLALKQFGGKEKKSFFLLPRATWSHHAQAEPAGRAHALAAVCASGGRTCLEHAFAPPLACGARFPRICTPQMRSARAPRSRSPRGAAGGTDHVVGADGARAPRLCSRTSCNPSRKTGGSRREGEGHSFFHCAAMRCLAAPLRSLLTVGVCAHEQMLCVTNLPPCLFDHTPPGVFDGQGSGHDFYGVSRPPPCPTRPTRPDTPWRCAKASARWREDRGCVPVSFRGRWHTRTLAGRERSSAWRVQFGICA